MIARILVTGSREWDDVDHIRYRLAFVREDPFFADAVLVHGGAAGADSIAARVWKEEFGGKVERVRAKWGVCAPDCPPSHLVTRNGRSWCPTAGHRRNDEMVRRGADLCLAFLRDGSGGTRDCIARARAAGIAVRVFDYDNPAVLADAVRYPAGGES